MIQQFCTTQFCKRQITIPLLRNTGFQMGYTLGYPIYLTLTQLTYSSLLTYPPKNTWAGICAILTCVSLKIGRFSFIFHLYTPPYPTMHFFHNDERCNRYTFSTKKKLCNLFLTLFNWCSDFYFVVLCRNLANMYTPSDTLQVQELFTPFLPQKCCCFV